MTDSNRRRARRWSTVRENVTGYTERPARSRSCQRPTATPDSTSSPARVDDAYTVTERRGATVQATAYGNNITYSPEDRPARARSTAICRTAWKVGDFAPVDGEHIRVDARPPGHRPTTSTSCSRCRRRNRCDHQGDPDASTAVDPVTTSLDDASRTDAGQTVTFPRRT